MNDFNLQKNAIPFGEESGGRISISVSKGPVVCPKPRRVGSMTNSPSRTLRWNTSTRAGAELLDIIPTKEEGHGADPSPPFFCGSPPTRVGNPLIQDARFGEDKQTPPSPVPIPSSPSGISSPSSAALKGGCARMKFGLKAAAVRVEGFDCLSRDRQNSSIPAMS